MASCHPDGGIVMDASVPMDDAGAGTFGDTMNNAEGDDDDCKYHVKWTSTPVCEGTGGVTFTVTATKKADGSWLTGAGPDAEVFLNDTHPSPSAGKSTETGPGVYTMGPIQFDAPGKWTVRFHFYGECDDGPADSPHGHAAFFVNVP